jgi:type II secretory pathway component PulC
VEKSKQMHNAPPKPPYPPEIPGKVDTSPEPPTFGRQPNIVMLKPRQRARRRSPVVDSGLGAWGFRLLQLSLVVLTVWVGFYTAQSHKDLQRETQHLLEFKADTAAQSSYRSDPRPLNNYRAAWDRGLFGPSDTESVTAKPIKTIQQAPKGLGLELVGTVVTGIADLNVAVVENRQKRSQETLHEGDRIGDLRIKKILRNTIIVVRDNEEMLLAMEIGGPGSGYPGGTPGPKPAQTATGGTDDDAITVEVAAAIPDPPPQKQITYRLKRAEMVASLSDPETFETVEFLPHNPDAAAAGFQLGNLTYDNALAKLGLISTDVIRRINGEAVTDPGKAAAAFRRLGQGEDLEIDIVRGSEPWKISVRVG